MGYLHKTFSGIGRRLVLPMLFLASFSFKAPAQTDARMKAILFLSGAESEEELDEYEVERFSAFLSSPLELNLAGMSRIVSSGLLTRYQAASLADYRRRNGDVLTFAELAAVDGFGEEYVRALRPFVSLRSLSLPGAPAEDTLVVRQEGLANSALKGGEYSWGAKYRASFGNACEVGFAAKSAYSDKGKFPPSSWSGTAAVYGRRRAAKLIAGDYSARFGQGLSLWSGMSLSGLSSSSSFSRRPSGLSPSWSWSGIGTHRGVASDFSVGKAVVSAFVSFPGLRSWCESGRPAEISLLAGSNMAFYGRKGQFSVTGYLSTGRLDVSPGVTGGKVSADFRRSWRGTDTFGELCWDFSGRCAAMLAGAVFSIADDWKLSAVAHSYPEKFTSEYAGALRSWTKVSDEHSLALGLERAAAVLTFEFALKDSDPSMMQGRMLLKFPVQLTPNSLLSFKVTERFRPYDAVLKRRTGGRCDFDWSSSGLSARYGPSDEPAWKCRVRAEGLLCKDLAGLFYAEGGRSAGRFSAYVRGTVFIVDNWDDRIYSYERDAPGSFNVPAYYGRGWSLSAVAGGKFPSGRGKALKLYFRASTVQYSFMENPKPGKFEMKVQAVLRL